MKCPNCDETNFFRVDAWEVNSYAAYLNGTDIEDTKYDETIFVAIEPGYAKCMTCDCEEELEKFGIEGWPFTVMNRPNHEAPELPSREDLVAGINRLLGCTDLNLDDLDETSISAIEYAQRLIAPLKAQSAPDHGGECHDT